MEPLPADTLLVAADDRTGALEVAGACAAAGTGPVRVVPSGAAVACAPGGRVVVVDLGSRHADPLDAASAAAALDAPGAGADPGSTVAMHKIDSTLRGNWAHELVARQQQRGGRVLLVPALPALGRSCIGGEVREHGRPVAEMTGAIDARAAVTSSRPADLLLAAGATAVAAVAPGASLDAWLRADDDAGDAADGTTAAFAVCDAASTADLVAIAAAWAPRAARVCIAGTSASVAAAVAALGPAPAVPTSGDHVAPTMGLPWLVVAGSLHPATAAQVDALVSLGARSVALAPGAPDGLVAATVDAALDAHADAGVLVLRCASPGVAKVAPGAAAEAAATLAVAASFALRHDVATLVVLGGDTAAAVLADRAIDVGGTVAPGVPWGRVAQGEPPGGPGDLLVVTKAGAFGGPDLLARLLPERNLR